MAKLVVLSAGFTGRTHDLNVDKTTIGRVEDNTFQIADPSVSSHHCEVLLRGSDVVVNDLNSTNGSFINGNQFTGESVLKPGQTLKLGQIELQLVAEGMPLPAAATSSTDKSAPAPAPVKKLDSTMVVPRGVSLNELAGGTHGSGFDTTNKGFSKKKNKTNQLFIIGAIVVVVVIGIVLLVVISQVKK